MQLSTKAKEELKAILRKDIGEEGLAKFTDEGINDLGVRLLGIAKVCVKFELKKRRKEIESQQIKHTDYY